MKILAIGGELFHADIHSFSILSDDRPNVSSKTVPPHSAI